MRTVLVEVVAGGACAVLASIAWASQVPRHAARAVVLARVSETHPSRLAQREERSGGQ